MERFFAVCGDSDGVTSGHMVGLNAKQGCASRRVDLVRGRPPMSVPGVWRGLKLR